MIRIDGVSINRFQDKLYRTWMTIHALVMLVPLTGINWLFGLLSLASDSQLAYAYLFSITNALQGLGLFSLHCILQSDVHQRYYTWRSRHQIDCCARHLPERPSQITVLSFHPSSEQLERPNSVPPRRNGVQVTRPSSAWIYLQMYCLCEKSGLGGDK